MSKSVTAPPLYFHGMQRDTITTLAYQAVTNNVTYNIGIINQLLENHSFCNIYHIWHLATYFMRTGGCHFWSRNIVNDKVKSWSQDCGSLKITYDKCTKQLHSGYLYSMKLFSQSSLIQCHLHLM